MLQGNIAFICLIYMQYISISVYALLLKWLSAQSAVYTRLYTQVPTDLELETNMQIGVVLWQQLQHLDSTVDR